MVQPGVWLSHGSSGRSRKGRDGHHPCCADTAPMPVPIPRQNRTLHRYCAETCPPVPDPPLRRYYFHTAPMIHAPIPRRGSVARRATTSLSFTPFHTLPPGGRERRAETGTTKKLYVHRYAHTYMPTNTYMLQTYAQTSNTPPYRPTRAITYIRRGAHRESK